MAIAASETAALSQPIAIAEAMARLIADGDIPAGARITEREVAERFACSAAMAREVFHLLQKQGAVEVSARRGARVIDAAAAPPNDVIEVWDCLRALLGEEMHRAGAAHPAASPPSGVGSPSARLLALDERLGAMGHAARNDKLAQVLFRVAMHLAIVAPERLADVERSLER